MSCTIGVVHNVRRESEPRRIFYSSEKEVPKSLNADHPVAHPGQNGCLVEIDELAKALCTQCALLAEDSRENK